METISLQKIRECALELHSIAFKKGRDCQRTVHNIRYCIDNYKMSLKQAFEFEVEPQCALMKTPMTSDEKKATLKLLFESAEKSLKDALGL